jgi:formate dehydrogenase major subunit
VTAVQLTKVTQLSEWQREYKKFSETQIDFAKNPRTEANV